MVLKNFMKKKIASNHDIDAIISGTFEEKEKDGLLAVSDQAVDNIITGSFGKRGRGRWG